MATRKRKKKNKFIEGVRANMGKIVAGILTTFALVSGLFTLERHWVNYPYHEKSLETLDNDIEIKLAQVANTVEKIQRNAMIKSAQDEVFFWIKTEMQMMEVKARLGKSPSKEFDMKYNEATQQRKCAEDKLKQLQEQK